MLQGTSLRRDARGATAIEYAIIAGLIGLGLVGSLVTTRGSLSGVLNTASSQMGSASNASTTAAPALPSLAARKAYWEAKGLARAPSYQGAINEYAFSDGSSVRLGIDRNAASASEVIITDAATNKEYVVQVNFGSNLIYDYVHDLKSGDIVYSSSFSGSPPVPTVVTQGAYSNAVNRAPTQDEVYAMQNAYFDFMYFSSIYKPN